MISVILKCSFLLKAPNNFDKTNKQTNKQPTKQTNKQTQLPMRSSETTKSKKLMALDFHSGNRCPPKDSILRFLEPQISASQGSASLCSRRSQPLTNSTANDLTDCCGREEIPRPTTVWMVLKPWKYWKNYENLPTSTGERRSSERSFYQHLSPASIVARQRCSILLF